MMRTPYGARITWKLPGGNDLVAHLKDNDKIRHKKRWSQVLILDLPNTILCQRNMNTSIVDKKKLNVILVLLL